MSQNSFSGRGRKSRTVSIEWKKRRTIHHDYFWL
ncbi:MAG: translation initiation factor IF-2 associated domain-containing protein [Flavobacteriales bacterium]|nr:translation initiation factor IF-2 associated domain-containing protein [Flavobacteriales bacterium]MBN8623798.1 translation initiation factor IF-2 associated domain-containing protein [Flavobacteriales bacterium]MCA0392478.1 translation initiation factor IF-2 associated domain-containing protein [Bacteroidota bacterium]UBB91080.1 translation initiation factor IF-2 associated domain-containing protein [Candidatus Kaistella beijingensis]